MSFGLLSSIRWSRRRWFLFLFGSLLVFLFNFVFCDLSASGVKFLLHCSTHESLGRSINLLMTSNSKVSLPLHQKCSEMNQIIHFPFFYSVLGRVHVQSYEGGSSRYYAKGTQCRALWKLLPARYTAAHNEQEWPLENRQSGAKSISRHFLEENQFRYLFVVCLLGRFIPCSRTHRSVSGRSFQNTDLTQIVTNLEEETIFRKEREKRSVYLLVVRRSNRFGLCEESLQCKPSRNSDDDPKPIRHFVVHLLESFPSFPSFFSLPFFLLTPFAILLRLSSTYCSIFCQRSKPTFWWPPVKHFWEGKLCQSVD